MKNYIVYRERDGRIQRTGICSDNVLNQQAKENELVIEGIANDRKQKIIDGKIVNKTPQEIEADNPTPAPIPFEKKPANITNEQWQEVLDRISVLESEV